MEKIIKLPRFSRDAEFRAQSYNEEKSTIDLVWTTGATVRRRSWVDGPYDEELIVSEKTVRLDRLNGGAPFLNSHSDIDLSDIIGSVVPGSARIEDGLGIATVQLSRRDDIAGIAQDIRDGIIRNVSVGYKIHGIDKQERKDSDVPLWRIIDWEPMELSAVGIPADAGAQIRSGSQLEMFPCQMACSNLHAFRVAARMRLAARELGLVA